MPVPISDSLNYIIQTSVYDRRVMVMYKVLRSFTVIFDCFVVKRINGYCLLYQHIANIAFTSDYVSDITTAPTLVCFSASVVIRRRYPVSIKSSCNIYILFAPCNFSKNPFYYLRLFRYYLNLSESVSAFGNGIFIRPFTISVAVHQIIRNFACRKPLFISPFYIF